MSKQRMVDTKFWSDGYISTLDPTEKLLFLYLLTNESTNIAGIYEITARRVAFDTGIDAEMIEKIIKRFESDKKIFYQDGWLIIYNFIKHQAINPKVEKGIADIIQSLPQGIKEFIFTMNPELFYFEEIELSENRNKNTRNIIQQRGTVCEECNNNFNEENLVIHHIIPLFGGGNNKSENLKVLCKDCHREIHKIIGYDSLSKASGYSNSNLNSNSNSNLIKNTPKFNSEEFFEGGEAYTILLDEFSKIGKVTKEQLNPEFKKFVLYWTEPNQSGTKVRWQLQKTFDVKRRLYTWLSNASKFSKGNQSKICKV